MTCFGWILTNLTAGVMGFDLLQNETVLLGIHRGKAFQNIRSRSIAFIAHPLLFELCLAL
jgi:hypothetical protein